VDFIEQIIGLGPNAYGETEVIGRRLCRNELINPGSCSTDTIGMSSSSSQPVARGLGIDAIVLRHPSAATNNLWQVEVVKGCNTRGCYDALNAAFAPEHQQVAENYARRMMRILQTDCLKRVA
jgi:hypothetical protein